MSIVTTVLAVIGWILFAMAIIVGIGLNLLGLFGNWIILGAVIAAWVISGFTYFGIYTIIAMAVLAAIGEIIEAVAAGYGAARFGGTKGTIVAAIAGTILGAIVFTPIIPIPLIGTVIGACLGAFIGATAYELTQQREEGFDGAVRVGFGAALGKVAGLLGKSITGFIMLGVAAWGF